MQTELQIPREQKYKESVMIKANELMSVAINYCVQQDLTEYNRSDALAPRIVGGFLVERLTGEVVNADPENPTGVRLGKSLFERRYNLFTGKIAGVWTNTGTSWDV